MCCKKVKMNHNLKQDKKFLFKPNFLQFIYLTVPYSLSQFRLLFVHIIVHKEDVETGAAEGMMLGAPTVPTVPTTTASSSSAPLPRKKRYLQENPPSPLKAAVPTTTAQSLSSTSGPSVTSTRPRLTTTLTEVYEDQSSAWLLNGFSNIFSLNNSHNYVSCCCTQFST